MDQSLTITVLDVSSGIELSREHFWINMRPNYNLFNLKEN